MPQITFLQVNVQLFLSQSFEHLLMVLFVSFEGCDGRIAGGQSSLHMNVHGVKVISRQVELVFT